MLPLLPVTWRPTLHLTSSFYRLRSYHHLLSSSLGSTSEFAPIAVPPLPPPRSGSSPTVSHPTANGSSTGSSTSSTPPSSHNPIGFWRVPSSQATLSLSSATRPPASARRPHLRLFSTSPTSSLPQAPYTYAHFTADKMAAGGGKKKSRLAIIGSGNWGSAIAKIAGKNVSKHSDLFEEEVKMYVYEEEIQGRKLTQIINEEHENVKYLPGIKLPTNIKATASATEAATGADLLIFVLPHQFIESVCKELRGKVSPDAHAISMIKGVEVKNGNIRIFADVIEEILGCRCAALSGANIANEVAEDKFSETTIGYRPGDLATAERFLKVFDTPTFRVGMVEDVAGVSLCGALKNVVAIAAGFTDGLGWGSNAKAAVMRIGLMEMKRFSEEFFEGVKAETFTETSAGIADLITTCFGGRNRKCAEAFVKTGKSFDVLERELLNGQKLQGTETAREIHQFLKARGRVDDYPLFKSVFSIAYEGQGVTGLTSKL